MTEELKADEEQKQDLVLETPIYFQIGQKVFAKLNEKQYGKSEYR